ncbi:hypothetical protein HBI62_112170 [Parastagonospora nodorum]|nr:hypothetical protein HBI62_112170 [Parastagonospora nodorum]KAH6153027.1 hypothetical protein HBI63_111250 [Parastagonospora nodorum]KAH6187625.1 hypothetical protein HBI61_044960 [Parastagonospora nodorum]
MADRRGVRAASRRKTPTPQPPSKASTPQPGRASRMRSASRDVEPVFEVPKPTRRSARQASVATVTDESENEGQTTRRTIRRPVKEAAADLTVVEEEIDLQEAPDTPKHTQLEHSITYRSPGAASEMSGTTAISSFSMIEAEFLEPKYILKHMRKLCESAREFLEHLAPDGGNKKDDIQNIQEIQKPDSDFTEEYRDFNDELNVHLKHYKSEEHSYIHVKAVHRVLFGAHPEFASAQTGLDLILYMANLLVFAKQMIHSDRSEKQIWNALRQLDNSFPSQFMRSLEREIVSTIAGDSGMLQETFDLALELRTQLAILVLEKSAGDGDFNPDETILEVFYRSEPSQSGEGSLLRGWNIQALGGEDSALPQQLEARVSERISAIRRFFPRGDDSLERDDIVDLDGLSAEFPWLATILRLLHWVRHRHRELFSIIDEIGGPTAIVRNVKQLIDTPPAVTEQPNIVSNQPESPRRKRTSFVRDRRRSSRKFDPNAPIDMDAINLLKSRERVSEASTARQVPESLQEEPTREEAEEAQDELPVMQDQQDDNQSLFVGEDEEQQEEDEPLAEEQLEDERPLERPEVVIEEEEEEEEEEVEEEADLEDEAEPEPAGPPTSSAALLKALKKVKPQKENRATSIFDRQAGARSLEFGDGFDSQSTPGPSTKDKGKQRAQPSSNRKRSRPAEVESESEDDAFETEDRTARVQERRQKAPVAKKVRIDPTSSAAPTSHQPRPRSEVDDDVLRLPRRRPTQDESISENEAPDMTEEAPPSTYQAQRKLAKQNIAAPTLARRNERKQRTDWTTEEEDAFAQYMSLFPAKYSAILRHDADHGYNLLQERTQVNLKDKARTMAINMIKSGTGLMTGFEDIVKPSSVHGQALLAQGFTW